MSMGLWNLYQVITIINSSKDLGTPGTHENTCIQTLVPEEWLNNTDTGKYSFFELSAA